MKNEIIKTAATVKLAVEEACKELGVSNEDVEIEILEQPRRKLFGLIKNDAKVKVTFTEPKIKLAETILLELIDKMGISDIVKIDDVKIDEYNVEIDLSGDADFLIENNAEVLDSIQYIVNLMVNDRTEPYIRVSLDYNSFRKKEVEDLIKLTEKLVSQAIDKKVNVTMEPMNPYKRRIVHSTIQDIDGVNSSSVGKEPNRCVVIRPENAN